MYFNELDVNFIPPLFMVSMTIKDTRHYSWYMDINIVAQGRTPNKVIFGLTY